jgi:hypothetical protein
MYNRYSITGEHVVRFYIKSALKALEIVEAYDRRIPTLINALAQIASEYPDRNPKQKTFDLYTGTKLEKLQYDCK